MSLRNVLARSEIIGPIYIKKIQIKSVQIPLDPAVISVCEEFKIDSTTIALNGGEDYELLFGIAQNDFEKIKGNPNFTIIGHFTEENEGMHLITRDDQKIELITRGWNGMGE